MIEAEKEVKAREEKLARLAVCSISERYLDVKNLYGGALSAFAALFLCFYEGDACTGWNSALWYTLAFPAVVYLGHYAQPIMFFIVKKLVSVKNRG